MRVSAPTPLLTILTSAPTISHRLAISFIKLIRVASIALEAYLIISAERISVNIILYRLSVKGLYSRSISFSPFSDSTPTTTLSGLIKSFMASPSLRNSGLEATSKGISSLPLFFNSSAIISFTKSEVPTGTVLFVTTRV